MNARQQHLSDTSSGVNVVASRPNLKPIYRSCSSSGHCPAVYEDEMMFLVQGYITDNDTQGTVVLLPSDVADQWPIIPEGPVREVINGFQFTGRALDSQEIQEAHIVLGDNEQVVEIPKDALRLRE